MNRDCIVLSKKEYDKCLNDRELDYSFLGEKKMFIHLGFLLYFINTDDGFSYFKECIKNRVSTLKIGYEENGEVKNIVSIDIVNALKLLKGLSMVNKERLELINQACTLDSLLKDYDNEMYSGVVNNKGIEMKAKTLIKIFLSSASKQEQYFAKLKQFGVSKKEILYLINEFLLEEEIVKRYVFPSSLINRYKRLTNYQIIDFEAINKRGSKLPDAYISEELKQYLYKDMNPKYNDLQKAIYLYIKMCKYLSYDPSYYTNDTREGYVVAYEDSSRLKDIKDDSHNIVCYEFNYMYAKLLEELNIKYGSHIKKLENGRGHANLEFVYGKYIVLADAVTSVFNGDLVNAKINTTLEGIRCINKSQKTVAEFEKILDEVYQDMIEQDISKSLSDDEIYNLLLIYRKLNDVRDNDNNKIENKLKILFEELTSFELKTMDAMGYLLKLRNVIFTKYEVQEHICVAIVKYHLDDKTIPVAIFTINEKHNIYEANDNKYYWYVAGEKQKEISKERLESLLDNKQLEYISYTNAYIPGLEERENNYDRKVKNKK